MMRFFDLAVLTRTFFILLTLIFPMSFNLYNQSKSLILGFILIQIILFPVLVSKEKISYSSYNKEIFIFLLFALMILLNQIVSEAPLLSALVLVALLLINMINCQLITQDFVKNTATMRRALYLSYFIIVALGIIKVVVDTEVVPLIGEPSYFALIAGPLALYCYAFDRRFAIVNMVILSALSVSLPNATIALFAVINLAWLMARHKLAMILLIIVVIFVGPYAQQLIESNSYFSARLTSNAHSGNLSSLLFLVNWSDVWDRITSFEFWGSGVGSEASGIDIKDDYSLYAIQRYGLDLTYTSGTFWLARAVQTVGLSSFFFVALSLWRLIRVGIQSSRITTKVAFAGYAAMLPELFFRSASIFSYLMIWFSISAALESLPLTGEAPSRASAKSRGLLRRMPPMTVGRGLPFRS